MVSESYDDGQETQELSRPNGVCKEQALDVGGRAKTRHPRWTKQETFVLIEGKRGVENQFQRSRRSNSALGSDQIESKWDSVSSYCTQHGIKTWESQRMNEAESFWMMRNELRRERKLPSFFDKEVYHVLDGRVITTDAIPLDKAATAEDEEKEEHDDTESNFDSSQCARAGHGLFLEWEQSGQEKIYWSSKKETTATGNLRKTQANPLPISSGKDRCLGRGRKGDRLITVLGRNMSMLNSQLEAQNINCQLDREQRNDHNDSLARALSKLTDAIVKIADKL
ncbi:trihelix transcription factor [Salix suchowensis]|nr:trihelix transcription factor [Salix suchowensis]